MRGAWIAIALLLASCGQETSGTENGNSSEPRNGGQAQAGSAQAVAVPERAEGAFRLVIRATMEDGAAPPAGYRVLRLPPRLEDFPPGAQVDRRDVQKGAWRPYLGPDQAVIIDLEPTPEVVQDRWMVVAYAQNDVHQFRFADANFKLIELGSSPIFELELEGGEIELEVAVKNPLQLQPTYEEGQLEGPVPFEFQYRPIAASPRTLRGDWSAEGPLPILLSRYAIGRESQLKLTLDGWPQARTLGPVEAELTDGDTDFDFGFLPRFSPWVLQAGAEGDGASWAQAEILAGFHDDEGNRVIETAGKADSKGSLRLERAFAGRYHLSALREDGEILLGWDSHGGEEDRTVIATPPLQETGTMDCVDLPEGEWQAEIWSFWGPILIGRSTGVPGEALTLPHAGEMRHTALVRRDVVGEFPATIAYLFLECEWHDGKWVFHGAPTSFKVDSFTDEIELELRLSLTDNPEPQQFFPPPHWQLEPGKRATAPYFPLRYRGGLLIHGLPDGQYEAGIFGREPGRDKLAELATFYPIAEPVLDEDE